MEAKLFHDDPPNGPPETLSKRGFAEAMGVTPGRISQLIVDGLPTEPNGRINVERGQAWYHANIDPNRRRIGAPSSAHQFSHKAARDEAEARIATLKADQLAGSLIDRKAALAAIETQARSERDAWIGWVNRVAPEIARETNSDLSMVTGLLDRLVRDQLAALADMPAAVSDD